MPDPVADGAGTGIVIGAGVRYPVEAEICVGIVFFFNQSDGGRAVRCEAVCGRALVTISQVHAAWRCDGNAVIVGWQFRKEILAVGVGPGLLPGAVDRACATADGAAIDRTIGNCISRAVDRYGPRVRSAEQVDDTVVVQVKQASIDFDAIPIAAII